jgi:hypothetical protein
VGPARMIAESLTSKPGIREQNRHIADLARYLPSFVLAGAKFLAFAELLVSRDSAPSYLEAIGEDGRLPRHIAGQQVTFSFSSPIAER